MVLETDYAGESSAGIRHDAVLICKNAEPVQGLGRRARIPRGDA